MFVDDQTRLEHMRQACNEAIELTRNACREDLDTDRKLNLALARLLEIIGEAANGISPEFKESHPTLPWHGAISMRNRLIHGYFDINLDVVWRTVKEDLPDLLVKLEEIS
jgi:uncharacterized protein with HEPN domain